MVERMTLNHVVAGSIPAVGKYYNHGVDSSMVRIRAFQARGPGSIPGRRMLSERAYSVKAITEDSESSNLGSNPSRPMLFFATERCYFKKSFNS